MKKFTSIYVLCFALIIILLPGCQAIGDIFKAGVWSGIIIVVLILALVLYLFSRGSKKE